MKGIFSFSDKSFRVQAEEYTIFENSSCIALYDGVPLCESGELFRDAALRSNWGEAFIGPFLLIIYNKKDGNILITQHMYGDGKNLFLTRRDDLLMFSSTLRGLKALSEITFRLNMNAVPAFITNGFVAGTETLIEGVTKLEHGVTLKIDENGIHSEDLDLSLLEQDLGSDSLKDAYYRSLSESIDLTVTDIEEPVSLALSGGYDSNCILYSIKKKWPGKKIGAYCVGGVKDTDETGVARELTAIYGNVDFKLSLVSPATLTHLDEIVEILEGTVYERGIFLQYELAKLLSGNGVHTFVCGECADQVFHAYTYKDIPRDTPYYCFEEHPWQMGTYVVLRKSRMTMNHFGIETRYPFVTPHMLAMGYQTRMFNGQTKEFHKSRCNELLPAEVTRHIAKHGGSTDLSPVFTDGFDCTNEAKKLKFYSPAASPNPRYGADEGARDYYLTLRYLESFEKQFCDEES